jgi:hypothetical protein
LDILIADAKLHGWDCRARKESSLLKKGLLEDVAVSFLHFFREPIASKITRRP